MENSNTYKIFQLAEYLIREYNYSQILLDKFKFYLNNDVWLYNNENPNYQIIRITLSNASQYEFERNRMNSYFSIYKLKYGKNNFNFLDIHICKEKFDVELEPFDYINIDDNYHDGTDISKFYLNIYNVVHNVEDGEAEFTNITNRLRITQSKKKKHIASLIKKPYYVTYGVIAICVLVYILSLFLRYKYDDLSSVLIVLGADYKTFTLGLGQYYRLFTYAFVHHDIIHLLCNMFSIYSLGVYVENRFGHLKYALILVFSIVIGCLTQGILSDNSVCVGLSAGIYALLVIFIIDMFRSRIINLSSLLPMIFINLFLNFLSTTAWMAHLGGAIAGFTIYYCYENRSIPSIILCIVLLLGLLYKYISIDNIQTLYGGTDLSIVKIYKDLGLNQYADNIYNKIIQIYIKYGG